MDIVAGHDLERVQTNGVADSFVASRDKERIRRERTRDKERIRRERERERSSSRAKVNLK